MKLLTYSVVFLIGCGLGAYGFLSLRPEPLLPPVGATPGSDFVNRVAFLGGSVNSTLVSSSSALGVTALTVNANNLRTWADASIVSYTPNMTTLTLTLPASSTIAAFIPRAGDRQSFCMQNATSTTATTITFAGGVGTKLLVASSSPNTLGSVVLTTGKIGCFTFIREVATSSAFDIDAVYTTFN